QGMLRFAELGRHNQLNALAAIAAARHAGVPVRESLAALATFGGVKRILAVLEPRSNTMKLGTMKAALPDSLRVADRVFCYSGNLGWDAAAALAPLGANAQVHESLAALVDAVAAEARTGDHVLVMSNAGFGGFHDKLLARLGG